MESYIETSLTSHNNHYQLKTSSFFYFFKAKNNLSHNNYS